jgi:hypothetical protein
MPLTRRGEWPEAIQNEVEHARRLSPLVGSAGDDQDPSECCGHIGGADVGAKVPRRTAGVEEQRHDRDQLRRIRPCSIRPDDISARSVSVIPCFVAAQSMKPVIHDRKASAGGCCARSSRALTLSRSTWSS